MGRMRVLGVVVVLGLVGCGDGDVSGPDIAELDGDGTELGVGEPEVDADEDELACGEDGDACDDGDPCTLEDHCTADVCVGGVTMACDDPADNACMQGACVAGACVEVPRSDGLACGVACQSGVCQAGACVWGEDLCPSTECTTGACDHATGECLEIATPGVPCTGESGCFSYTCNDVGACVGEPLCDAVSNCMEYECVKSKCMPVAPAEGYPCDDGEVCTTNDVCTAFGGGAVCQGVSDACDDGLPCTYDVCESGVGCQHEPVSGECDDGNVCTSNECVPGVGCVKQTLVGQSCSDGSPCTSDDVCTEGGTCEGEASGCDDGNDCTLDACDGGGGCTHVPKPGHCLVDGLCLAEGDGEACLVCDPAVSQTALTPRTDGAACDDGSDCTEDVCLSGQCVGTWTGCPVVGVHGLGKKDQTEPAVAVFADGSVVVAWTSDESADGQGRDVVHRRLGADLTELVEFGEEVGVAVEVAKHQQRPAVAVLPGAEERYVVAWETNDPSAGGNHDVRFRVYEADGAPWTGEVTVDAAGQTGQAPMLAALQDGRFVVVWTHVTAASKDVRMRLFDRDGAAVGESAEVTETASSGQEDVVAAALPGDRVAVAYRDNGQNKSVVHVVYEVAGEALVKIAGPALAGPGEWAVGTQVPMDVAPMGDGWMVVWEDQHLAGGTSFDQWAAVFEADGSAVGEPFLAHAASEEKEETARVATFGDGSFTFCFAAPAGAGHAVWARRYLAPAVPLLDVDGGPGELEVSETEGPHRAPMCRALGQGHQAIVVWESKIDGFGYDVFARIIQW